MTTPIQPNILFISDDQHRYDCLEMTGKFPVKTPNLARLAAEGVWHRHAYSTCPLCMPARASLHNGLYAHQTGLNTNIGHWPLGLPMLPGVLRKAGYHTAAIGKLHVFEGVPEKLDLTTVRRQVMSLGYDDLHEVGGKALAWFVDCEWTHHVRNKGLLETYRQDGASRSGPGGDAKPFALDAKDYQDVYIADHAVDWLEKYSDAKPFFLWAGLVSPHPPFDAPAEELTGHAPQDQPPPADNADPDAGRWLQKRAHYAAMVEIVDRQVGRMLDVLQRRGMLDNTLVIFVADHGEMLGDHGLAGKCYPHDPSIRVPLLARYPRLISPGTVSDAFTEIIDLPATCLEVATGCTDAAAALPFSPGRSLVAHWRRPSEPHRPFAYSEDGGQFFPPFQTIRTSKWKYTLYTRDLRETLFDMEADPDECRNLIGSPSCAAVIADLKSRLIQHIANTPPPVRD